MKAIFVGFSLSLDKVFRKESPACMYRGEKGPVFVASFIF